MPSRRSTSAQRPAQRFDTTLKELFQTLPSRLIELVLGAQPVEAVTIELPSVKQRRADLAYRLPDGTLHQFELQGDNDDAMDPRMLEYYALYWRQNRQPPIQHVLYIGQAPLKMTGRVRHPHLKYDYEVTDIRQFDPRQLLASEFIGDNLIAVLCQGGTRPKVVRAILQSIARLPERQRMDRFAQLLILSGLRKAEKIVEKEARNMAFEMTIENNSYLRRLYEAEKRAVELGEKRGEKRGEIRGEERGQRRLLRRLLEERFGELPAWADKKLEAADVATMESWTPRLLEAKRLEDVIPKPRPTRPRRKK
jgi:predicted transposase YdaD